eukprot:scaffold99941_cov61-Phaeocystis_antarctica.AAC.6
MRTRRPVARCRPRFPRPPEWAGSPRVRSAARRGAPCFPRAGRAARRRSSRVGRGAARRCETGRRAASPAHSKYSQS